MVLADAGYYSEANLEASESAPERFLVAVTNEHDQRTGSSTTEGAHKGLRGLLMRDELAREEGRMLYAKRAFYPFTTHGFLVESALGARPTQSRWRLERPRRRLA